MEPHTDWDNHTCNPSAQAREFADWISDNHETYELDAGTITHSQGGTLDLVISSNTISDRITECYVEPQLHITSDHKTLLTCLEFERVVANKSTGIKFRLEKMDEKQFCASLEKQKNLVRTSLHQAELALVRGGKSCEEVKENLDKFAQKATVAIHLSLELSTEKTKNAPRGEVWWNEKCHEALLEMCCTQKYQALDFAAGIVNPHAAEIFKEARIMLCKVVKKEKQNYYQKVIDELDHKNILQAVRWSSTVRQYTIPPIQQQDGTFATNTFDKQQVLRQELLTPSGNYVSDSTEVPNLHQESRAYALAWHSCTVNEIEAAIFQARNTFPGSDEISPLVIKRAWPIYKEEIIRLFQMCLEVGYPPQVFKTAKPGKRSHLFPQSYRLIALLSCLEKTLERIVARRLSYTALKYKLFSPFHFGATPRRSAVDAAATLTHDIEKAFFDKEIMSALAFDIKEAFDKVTDGRLVIRLWEQGIPLSLIRWVASLLNDRTAALRLDGKTGSQEPVKIGVPQGLPVAPILFMLFTAPLFKILTKEEKRGGLCIRGYVDDGLLTCRAKDETLSTSKVQTAFYKVEA